MTSSVYSSSLFKSTPPKKISLFAIMFSYLVLYYLTKNTHSFHSIEDRAFKEDQSLLYHNFDAKISIYVTENVYCFQSNVVSVMFVHLYCDVICLLLLKRSSVKSYL